MQDTTASLRISDEHHHRDLDTEFKILFEIMRSPKFRNSTGTAGEESYYLYDYPAESELEVADHIKSLINQLQIMAPSNPDDYAPKVLPIDLYDVAIGILEQRGILDKLMNLEAKRHAIVSSNSRKDRFLAQLDNILGADTGHLPAAIGERYQKAKKDNGADIVFITGIGKVYPYVRVHTLIDTLASHIDSRCPVVFFYPGTYETGSQIGSSMRLFGRLPAVNSYRAKSLRSMIDASQQTYRDRE